MRLHDHGGEPAQDVAPFVLRHRAEPQCADLTSHQALSDPIEADVDVCVHRPRMTSQTQVVEGVDRLARHNAERDRPAMGSRARNRPQRT